MHFAIVRYVIESLTLVLHISTADQQIPKVNAFYFEDLGHIYHEFKDKFEILYLENDEFGEMKRGKFQGVKHH